MWQGCMPHEEETMLVLSISDDKDKACWWWDMSDCFPTPKSPLLDDHKGGLGSSINSQDVKIMRYDWWQMQVMVFRWKDMIPLKTNDDNK